MKEFDFIEAWVKYITTNTNWRREHTRFINAQLINANNKIKKLSKDKLAEIFKINNKELLKKL